jgi:hypothetical protein
MAMDDRRVRVVLLYRGKRVGGEFEPDDDGRASC